MVDGEELGLLEGPSLGSTLGFREGANEGCLLGSELGLADVVWLHQF